MHTCPNTLPPPAHVHPPAQNSVRWRFCCLIGLTPCCAHRWQAEANNTLTGIERARAAKKAKKEKRRVGPWGGAVLAAVQAKAARRDAAMRVTRMCAALPDDVVRILLSSWNRPMVAHGLLSCVSLPWVQAMRATHVMSCMWLVLRCMPSRDRLQWTVCHELRARVASDRKRFISAAAKQRMRAVSAQWVGVRVSVPWESDGHGVAYEGIVLDVRCRGTCVRVELDEGAGRDRLRCHTIAIAELDRI